jgi:hypothetical protein
MADNKIVVEFELQGNATEKTQSLRAQMRQLREELAKLPEGTAEYNKVQRQLGELTDKVGDLSRSVNTLAGDPLERLNNSFGMIGSSILSLDFGAAQTGLQGVSSAIKDFKFGDLSKAAKGFGSTMLDLGKSLLLNPIFLLGGIIAAVVMNFDKLVEAGGFVGEMFGFIKRTIDSVIGGLVDFMDWIGLTDSKAGERAENEKKRAKEEQKRLDEAKKQRDEQLKKEKQIEREREKEAQEAYKKRKQLEEKEAKEKQEYLLKKKKLTEQYLREESDIVFMEEEKKSLTEIEFEKQRQENARIAAVQLGEIKTQYASEYAKKQAQIELEEADKSSAEKLAGEQAYQAAKLQIAQQAFGALMDLNSFLTDSGLVNAKKSFQINKALGIAQASIATYEGATNAFKTASASPITIGFPGYPALMAGIAITAGLAKVAKIAATKFNPSGGASAPSGGGGGGGAMGGMGGGGGSTAAPALDLSFLNNGQTKAQPIQSYVLATNVTSAQDAQQKILDQSKLIK